MCYNTINVVSHEPLLSLALMIVNNGALIFYTTFLNKSYFYLANFMMILIEPKTKAADDLFKFSHKMVMISYCSFSLSGVYLYKMLIIPDCCHESYS
jgi:hypothetical protein